MKRIFGLGSKKKYSVEQGQSLGNAGQSSRPSQEMHGGGALGGLGSRPIYTVVDPTVMNEHGRVGNPGHIQFQASQEEHELYGGLSPALGHGPRAGLPNRERFRVNSQLADGSSFRVNGIRADARNAGDDKVIDRGMEGIQYHDHGTMTPGQADRYRMAQETPVYPRYETSGHDGTNCVHGYAELGSQIFGNAWEAHPQYLHPHTMPQELGERTSSFRTTDYSRGNDSDSD